MLLAGFRTSDNNAPESFAQDFLAGPLGGDDFAEELEKLHQVIHHLQALAPGICICQQQLK